MPLPISAFALALAVASIATGWLFVVGCLRKRPFMGYYLILTGHAFAWTFLAFLYHVFDDPVLRETVLHLRYIPIALIPVFWLMFAIVLSGRTDLLRSRLVAMLFVTPLMSLVVLATKDYHHLFFTGLQTIELGSRMTVGHLFGPWFWVHAFYSYALFAAGIVVMAQVTVGASKPLRGRALLMLVGGIFPGVLSALYLSNEALFGYADPTPLGFAITTACFGLGILKYDVLNLIPIPAPMTLSALEEGIVVVTPDARVLQMNASARRILGAKDQNGVGRSLSGLLGDMWTGGETQVTQGLIPLDGDSRPGWLAYSVRKITTVDEIGPAETRGWVLTFRDATDQQGEKVSLSGRLEEVERDRARVRGALRSVAAESRGPLSGIYGLADVLAEDLEGEMQGYAVAISGAARRIEKAIDQAAKD